MVRIGYIVGDCGNISYRDVSDIGGMMKKLLFILFSVYELFATTYTVDANPSCWFGGWCRSCTGSSQYESTIQSALNKTHNGDTVEICSGTYNESPSISNSNIILKGVDGQAIDDVIVNGTGITINKQDAMIKNLKVISSSYGIHGSWQGQGEHTFEDLSIESSNHGIYLERGNVQTFKNISITTSSGYGIYTASNVNGDHTFSDINITSYESSILVSKGGVSYSHLILSSSTNRGLDLRNSNSKAITIIDANITSKNEGVYTARDAGGDHVLRGLTVVSEGTSIYLARGFLEISDVNITSQNRGIDASTYVAGTINNAIVNVTSGSEYGIYLRYGDSVALKVTNSTISSNSYGLYVGRSSSLNVDNVCINSAARGIYLPWDVYNAVIKNSRIENTSEWDLLLEGNPSSPASITGNCFYSSNKAKSNNSAHVFSGNYWDGHSGGTYTSGNVVDTSPLASCPISSCESGTTPSPTPTPLAEYRFDECNEASGLEDTIGDHNASVVGTAQIAQNDGEINSGVSVGSYSGSSSDAAVDTTINVKNDIGNSGTITFWYRSNSDWVGGGVRTLYDATEGAGSNNKYFYLTLGNDGKLYMGLEDTSDDDFQYYTTALSHFANEWVHITATWDMSADMMQLYVNGVNVLERTFSSNGSLGTLDTLYFGDNRNTYISAHKPSGYDGESGNGTFDEIKVYTSVLDATHISAIYSYELSGKNYDGSERNASTCSSYTLVSEYRFDECSYNETASEVKESINALHGTSHSGVTLEKNSTTLGGICSSAKFTDATKSSVTISTDALLAFSDAITMSAWIKRSSIDNRLQNIYTHGQWDNALRIQDDNRLLFQLNVGGSTQSLYSTTLLNDTNWHYVGATYDGSVMRLYIDGVEESTLSVSGTIGATNSFYTIGNEQIDTSYGFNGNIDELKVYNGALGSSDIATVYANESAKKQYDGTLRTCGTCTTNCFIDTFDTGTLNKNWLIIKNDNYTPNVQNGMFYLTDNTGNVATGVSLDKSFPAADNYIVIEFEHYAYNGSGADGITVTLSDANVRPITGAYGGSLGYAQKDSQSGFAGGWMGIGIDEYGNFSNPNDGNKVGGTGRVPDSIAIRGSESQSYPFIAGSATLSPGIDNKNSTTPSYGHKYRISIDTQNGKNIVTVERDTGSGFSVISGLNEVDATQQATAPENYILSFTGSTGGSTNYHAIDFLKMDAIDCGELSEYDDNGTSYAFDVRDTFRSGSDYTISTKIVEESFDLTIVEKNTTDFNGSICAIVWDSGNDTNVSDWEKVNFSGTEKNVTLSVNEAVKSAYVRLQYSQSSLSCPMSGDYNETNSSDRFAVRPKAFSIDTNVTTAKAGENFRLEINATADNRDYSVGYNEQNGSSFLFTYGESNLSCQTGNLQTISSPLSFSDGQVVLDINYSEVGKLEFNITEEMLSCSERFAAIDCNDKNISGYWNSDTDVSITETVHSLVVTPYKIVITELSPPTSSNAKSWLYMADQADFNVSMSYQLTAQSKGNAITRNFDESCSVESIDVTFDLNTSRLFEAGNELNCTLVLNENVYGMFQTTDKNITLTIPTSDIVRGESNVSMSFNFNRPYNTPQNPITLGIEEINATTSFDKDIFVVGDEFIFYYVKLLLKDVITTEDSVESVIRFLVYQEDESQSTSYLTRHTLNWYLNSDHESTDGKIVDIFVSQDYTEVNSSSLSDSGDVSIGNFSNGEQTLTITRGGMLEDNYAVIHLLLDKKTLGEWGWVSRYEEYNVTSGSNCNAHYCMEYTYQENSNNAEVGGGTYEGSELNTSKPSVGVKIFR